jgi:hypothetical protein
MGHIRCFKQATSNDRATVKFLLALKNTRHFCGFSDGVTANLKETYEI